MQEQSILAGRNWREAEFALLVQRGLISPGHALQRCPASGSRFAKHLAGDEPGPAGRFDPQIDIVRSGAKEELPGIGLCGAHARCWSEPQAIESQYGQDTM